MTFRHLTLSLLAGAVLIACGNATTDNKHSDSTPAAPVAQTAASGPVTVYSGTTIAPDESQPTIIDFNATWCGPCQRFAPIFEEVAAQYQGKARFLSVDVDDSPLIARTFSVSSIPQLTILLPDGTVRTSVGFMDKGQLIDFISPLLGD